MDDRTKHLIDLYQTESSKDINKMLENFSRITNCMFILVQNLYDGKVEIRYHHRELEGKYFRFGIANQSLIKLIRENKFVLVNTNANIIDIDSLYSITRMQIETFLILNYLLYDDISDEEKDFRYDIYKLHGVRKQYEFKISEPDSEQLKFIQKIEKEIEDLSEKIKLSPIYKSATTDQQKSYLKPMHAKLIKNEIVFSKSGIKKSRINDMWKIYSNYAHAEHISDRQYNHRRNNPNAIFETVYLIITINKILTAKLILSLKEEFKENKEKYEELDLRERIEIEMFVKL